ncbi:hypothetical protein J6590_019645 [Homalodisca vitripennis]|nr:hypothetical protein J6590_019645 [Homalodisca vitripennis]
MKKWSVGGWRPLRQDTRGVRDHGLRDLSLSPADRVMRMCEPPILMVLVTEVHRLSGHSDVLVLTLPPINRYLLTRLLPYVDRQFSVSSELVGKYINCVSTQQTQNNLFEKQHDDRAVNAVVGSVETNAPDRDQLPAITGYLISS